MGQDIDIEGMLELVRNYGKACYVQGQEDKSPRNRERRDESSRQVSETWAALNRRELFNWPTDDAWKVAFEAELGCGAPRLLPRTAMPFWHMPTEVFARLFVDPPPGVLAVLHHEGPALEIVPLSHVCGLRSEPSFALTHDVAGTAVLLNPGGSHLLRTLQPLELVTQRYSDALKRSR